MTYEIRDVQVIYDRDHGTENEGWYSRHNEYDAHGNRVNAVCDNPLDATTINQAIDEARECLGIGDDVEVEVLA